MSCELRRTPHVIREHAVAFLRPPVPDNIIPYDGERNTPLAQRGKNTHGMSSTQDYASGTIGLGERMGQPQICRRRVQVATKRDELEIPIILGAVTFGSEQNPRLKLIDDVTVPQHKSDRPVLATEGQVNTELLGCGKDRCLNSRVDLGIPIRDPGDRRWAD